MSANTIAGDFPLVGSVLPQEPEGVRTNGERHRSRPASAPAGIFIVITAVLASLLCTNRCSAQLPDGFEDTTEIAGLTSPTVVAFANDGRVFIAEKGGVIKVFDDIADTTATEFADLSENVYDYWDRGLLGLALHPDFPDTPYIYVLYTYDGLIGGPPGLWGDDCPFPPGPVEDGCEASARISRLEAFGDEMTGDELVLLEGWCQQFPSHSIGALAFGPDGALYASSGDGASFNYVDSGGVGTACSDDPAGEGGALRSQDLHTLDDDLGFNGCILRIDPDTGGALTDNPLYGGTTAQDDLIIAYGLRNPFRFTVHPVSGEVWIGDVGWGLWEEIDRIPDPIDATVENFGWPCYEGYEVQYGYYLDGSTICADLYDTTGSTVDPYYAYLHEDAVGDCGAGSSAISGLVFYESSGSFPEEYDDALFFCDYSRGCIWVMQRDTAGEIDTTSLVTFVSGVSQPVDLKVGPGGDLYYLDHTEGNLRRIQYYTSNVPPTVTLVADPMSGTAPLTVSFDASGSYDPDSTDTLLFDWDVNGDLIFGDATTATTSFEYGEPGTYLATVRVSDSVGGTRSTSVTITVDNSPPSVSITMPKPDLLWRSGDTIAFAGSADDPEEGLLPASSFTWEISLNHCHHDDPEDCHEHPVQTLQGVDGGTFVAPNHGYPASIELTLTAVDGGIAEWWDPSWSARRRIAFDNRAQGEDLADFPALVRLDATRIDYDRCAADGADLRFLATDGTTPLAHEIESWDASGDSYVWVNLPLVEADGIAFVWMYYGNLDATDGQAPDDVWNSGYAGVWHMDASLEDATANANDATDSSTTATTGVFGAARSFDGSAHLNCGNDASLGFVGAITLEAWINLDDPDQFGYMRVFDKKQEWNSDTGFNLEYNPELNTLITLGSADDFGSASADLDSGWHHVAATHNDGAAALFVDGVEITDDDVVSTLTAGTLDLTIGRRSGGDDYFYGAIDEARISSVARSPAWFAAQFASHTDAFASFELQQTRGQLSGETTLVLYPAHVEIFVESEPPGILVSFGENSAVTPFAFEAIVNSTVSVAAPESATIDGTEVVFAAWSDGGERSHTILIGEETSTIVVSYDGFTAPIFTRGDCNGDTIMDISDAVFDLRYQFADGPLRCLDAHDLNDDGVANVADTIYGLQYVFLEGRAPLAPFGASACGTDPSEDDNGEDLGCSTPPPACL